MKRPKKCPGLEPERRLKAGVREILLKRWDPIGVGTAPEAQDEYDGYVVGICKLLLLREPREGVIGHIWQIENEFMGVHGNREHTEAIADMLIRFREEVLSGSG